MVRDFSGSFGVLALLLPFALASCTATQGQRLALAPKAEPVTERDAAPDYPSGGRYDALIARYAAENNVPLPLAHAVVQKESGYNAGARGAGTIGLMQIKPATARGIGYRGSTAGLYDPETNLRWGMKYLGRAYQLGGGDTCGAALRYQGGHRATRMSASSRRYCEGLKSIMARNGS